MTGVLESKIQNVLWGIRLIPTQIEVAYKSDRAMKDPEYINNLAKKAEEKAKKKQDKEQKRQDKEILKAAKEAAKEDREESISASVQNAVMEMANDNELKKMNLVARATETNKLIQFACFYMTDERAKLIKRNQKEKEIINGIAELFDFGKIYESVGVASLKMYDFDCKEDYIPTTKYLLSIKDIEHKKNDPIFMEKMKARKEQLLAESEHPQDDEPEVEQTSKSWWTDEEGVVHPIFITNPEEITPVDEKPIQGYGISDDLFTKLESTFVPLLDGKKHRYEVFGDLIHLFITRDNGIEEFYAVDPGVVMGKDEICVLSSIGNDTLFVSTKHDKIIRNILSTVFYILTPEEIQDVIQDYFRNMTIYRYIDMSHTEFLKDLTKEEFQKLGKKLTYILNQVTIQNQGVNDLPRFRFNMWNGVDDFMIISDPDVKSPLKHTNETSSVICEGLMFEVKCDDIIQRYRSHEVTYHIEKYGDM